MKPRTVPTLVGVVDVLDQITKWFPDRGKVANPPTRTLGARARKARNQANLTQADLAKRTYRRPSSLSDIENGKIRIDLETLSYLVAALRKPGDYFFPTPLTNLLTEETLSVLERELLMQARRLKPEGIELLVAQARALADLAEARSVCQNQHTARAAQDHT
jgi:transcriptional regulator with XRE-family HTH domain